MTEPDAITVALSAVDCTTDAHVLLRRNGRFFMALPTARDAAMRTLKLYQPQRPKAVLAMRGMRLLAACGLHRIFLPKLDGSIGKVTLDPGFPGCVPGSAGVLLGSPEHRVQRAILSYQTEHGWEVAKIFFGPEGVGILEQEARVLDELAARVKGVPSLLGLHRAGDTTVLRMPYLTGDSIQPGDSKAAVDLLQSWITEEQPKPITCFPEWSAIEAALSGSAIGKQALEQLSSQILTPVICHGDFARWNLRRQADGSLVVLDWEWGHVNGMPGIDLVHYFLQDARLVRKKPAPQAIREALAELNRPQCRSYLEQTGWGSDLLLPIIASLAWTQGARHQENAELLEAALLR